MKKRLFLLFVILSMAALVAACGSNASNSNQAPAQSSQTPSETGEAGESGSAPADSEKPKELVKIKAAYPALSGAMLQIWVMEDAKLDEKYGLDMELVYLQGTPPALQALDSGEIDFTYAGGTGVLSANLSGQDVIYIANPQPKYVFYLYGQPGINSLEDLRGKTFAAGPVGAAFDNVPRYAFKQVGMDVDKDLKEYVHLGNASLILAALEKGTADGGVLSPPHSFSADKQGFTKIADMTKEGPNTISVGMVTKKETLQESPEVAKNFMKAFVEAVQVIKEDPETAKKALANYSGIKDEGELEQTYEIYKETFPNIPYVYDEQVLDIAAGLKDAPSPLDPKQFYDNSLLEQLEKEGFVKP